MTLCFLMETITTVNLSTFSILIQTISDLRGKTTGFFLRRIRNLKDLESLFAIIVSPLSIT